MRSEINYFLPYIEMRTICNAWLFASYRRVIPLTIYQIRLKHFSHSILASDTMNTIISFLAVLLVLQSQYIHSQDGFATSGEGTTGIN